MKKATAFICGIILIVSMITVSALDTGFYEDEDADAVEAISRRNESDRTKSHEMKKERSKPLGDRPETGWVFGFSGVGSDDGYYAAVEKYLNSYIQQEGDQVLFINSRDDAKLQIRQLREMADKGVDAVFLIPVDLSQLSPVLEELREKKIPVIVMSQEASETTAMISMVDSDNFNAGFILADYMVNNCEPGETMYKKAKILTVTEKSHNFGREKIYGFCRAIGDTSFEIEKEIMCTHKKADIERELVKAMEETEDIKYIFSICDEITLPILEICEEKQYDVQVFTTGGSPEIKKKMEENNPYLTAFAAESPISLAMSAYAVMHQYLDGEKVKKQYLTETFLVTRENLSEYGVDMWQ